MDSSQIPKSIKELGKSALTKVADKFVDFIITKYTGKTIKVFEAEGDIEADKVKTKWEVLEKPFWLQAEAQKMNRQYSNLGKVLLEASPLIEVSENKITDDNDVFWGFLEHSKEISNNEMQVLIAKIIAGEYNAPGTYTMSTLQTVKCLGKNELELFEKICSLLLNEEQLPASLFTGEHNLANFMKVNNFDFRKLQYLQSLGLILPNDMRRTMANDKKQNLKVQYFNKELIYTPENDNFNKLVLPDFYGMSPVGEQILKHLKPVFQSEYLSWIKDNYKIQNYKLLEIKEISVNTPHPPTAANPQSHSPQSL